MFFMTCHLAGRQYHDADEVWNKLKVGTLLQLEHDSANHFDPNAVAVLYKKVDEKEPYCIGYIPRSENKVLSTFIQMGWKDMFECRISMLNPVAHPEAQVRLTIKIKKNM